MQTPGTRCVTGRAARRSPQPRPTARPGTPPPRRPAPDASCPAPSPQPRPAPRSSAPRGAVTDPRSPRGPRTPHPPRRPAPHFQEAVARVPVLTAIPCSRGLHHRSDGHGAHLPGSSVLPNGPLCGQGLMTKPIRGPATGPTCLHPPWLEKETPKTICVAPPRL